MRVAAGFTMIELLAATVVFVLAALLGSSYIARTSSELTFSRDQLFARQKALAILAEIRSLAARAEFESASDLDTLDDGGAIRPNLTVMTDPESGQLLPPNHPVSANVTEGDGWRWGRSIRVTAFGTDRTKDRRLCSVRIVRYRHGVEQPDRMAEVSGVVQTMADAHVAKQVLDLYVIAIENVPSLWTSPDHLPSLVSNSVKDAERRNPGLRFRVHWITRMGYGRDEEYAPHSNSSRRTDETLPLAYFYPGRLPDGARQRLVYPVRSLEGRYNLDFAGGPAIQNGYELPEAFEDANGNGRLDGGEYYTDSDGDDKWDPGNLYPYALADMHNHAKRHPDALAHFRARVDAGNDRWIAPTWRLLLDGMISEPDRYRNALILNTHGSLLPLPPVRNYSDAASSPGAREGWRVVTHPERIAPRRVAGNDTASVAPRLRVYAYRTAFEDDEVVMALPEPYTDKNGNGFYDGKDSYEDLNRNGRWDSGLPITLSIPGGDLVSDLYAGGPDALVVRCLRGGVDADGDGTRERYDAAWGKAPRLPEPFTDTNGNGICEVAEPFLDLNGNGVRDDFEPYIEVDGNGVFTPTSEPFDDALVNGRHDPAAPAERFDDKNGNGRYDGPEPFWDYDGDGRWTKPKRALTPRMPWDPSMYGSKGKTETYIRNYGEPFRDLDGDDVYDEQGEPFDDINGNGRRDSGYERGDMFYTARYDAVARRNLLHLYGTPLETPPDADGRGLDPRWRLYDYDYVPCPTPQTPDATDRFGRDLSLPDASVPKNTARWTLEIPPAAIRRAYESVPGARDGDARDLVLSVETRIGMELDTGVVWPKPAEPQNLSRTHLYYYADPERVPYSERYQFQGDPRHAPYADTDARGESFPHGYNWYFDDLRVAGIAEGAQPRGRWAAFDWSRLSNGWAGRVDFDLPRYLAWVRTALARSGATYTHLGGSFLRYVSLGGDVALLDSAGAAVGVPCDGRPYGKGGQIEISTLGDVGSDGSRGSRTYVRATKYSGDGLRAGGSWWAKPWIGELFPDKVYYEQWSWFGNLLAEKKESDTRFAHALRDDMPAGQLPWGTGSLARARAELGPLGITSFFAAGTPSAAVREQRGNRWGYTATEGRNVAEEYGFEFADPFPIAARFQLRDGPAGDVNGFTSPPEWSHPTAYPRWDVELMADYLVDDPSRPESHGAVGVRLLPPPGTEGLGRAILTGATPLATANEGDVVRHALGTLLNAYAKEGLPDAPSRVHQLPRVTFLEPLPGTTLQDPSTVSLRWSLDWSRWDGRRYHDDYPAEFAEVERGLVYVPMISDDFGTTWRNMIDGSWAFEGEMPARADGTPDPARTLRDNREGGLESWTMMVPAETYPTGAYIVRVEVHDPSRGLHYAYKTERIDVRR